MSERVPQIHVAARGNAEAAGTRTDPVDSLQAARDLLRARRTPGEPAVIQVAGGHYRMTEPLVLEPQDSNTSIVPAADEAPVVLEGAIQVTTWRQEVVNGVAAWVADVDLPAVRSLFVRGARRPRPRYPRESFLRIEGQPGLDLDTGMIDLLFQGSDQFHYAEGDVWRFHDLEQVDAVVPHYWVEERMPVVAIDEDNRLLRSSHRSIFALRDDAAKRFARYYLDNVFEAFGQVPGEWYHDRAGGRLLYMPLPDERLEDFAADVPVVERFLVAVGDAVAGAYVRDVRIDGITFRHADWRRAAEPSNQFQIPEDDKLPVVAYASAPQAAANVTAALEFRGARSCVLSDCAVEHIGGYALDWGPGCQDNLVSGCRLADLGGGGVKLTGATTAQDPWANRFNEVSDTEIVHGGRVFSQAVGILAQHAARCVFAHNHIHDLFYSGISVGWIWGYAENPSKSNRIENNHIHDLGHGLLNDMGGVYVLGVQPGTRVRGNLIHDVECANYGGWGIYLDEGSSHVVVENNICYGMSSQCFHQHYGYENTVRHNVFAFGAQGQVSVSRREGHVPLTFERNIVVGAGRPGLVCDRSDIREFPLISDLNLYWDVEGPAALAGNGTKDAHARWSLAETIDTDQWRALGRDRHSVIADPEFLDVNRHRFQVTDGSPVHELDIAVPDVSRAGPRPAGRRGSVLHSEHIERRSGDFDKELRP